MYVQYYYEKQKKKKKNYIIIFFYVILVIFYLFYFYVAKLRMHPNCHSGKYSHVETRIRNLRVEFILSMYFFPARLSISAGKMDLRIGFVYFATFLFVNIFVAHAFFFPFITPKYWPVKYVVPMVLQKAPEVGGGVNKFSPIPRKDMYVWLREVCEFAGETCLCLFLTFVCKELNAPWNKIFLFYLNIVFLRVVEFT